MDYDDEYETVFPLPFWAVLICALIVLLPGCSTTSWLESPPVEKPICFMKLLGQTETGLTVVAEHCVTQEEFDKAQQ